VTPFEIAGLVFGLVALLGGGELLVRGAARLATALGISPLLVGLTVVALGTSSPELAVAVRSAIAGQPDFVIGNVVGSNIYNVLLVLGLAALVFPLVVSRRLVRWDVPLLIIVSTAVLIMAADGVLTRLHGLLLTIGLLGYFGFSAAFARRDPSAPEIAVEVLTHGRASTTRNIVLLVAGTALLVGGATWFVDSAVALAQVLGLSELVIGLTVVALGTSLPELATTLVAGIRGERDIAVGNVVGSCLVNLLGILGLTSLIAPDGVAVARAALVFDMPVMLVVAIACLPIFFSEHRIDRWEGALFFGYAVAYTLYLLLGALDHAALPAFSGVMIAFVLPLTLVTLLVVGVRALHRSRSGSNG
jgi:cation:H+ antiporter